MQKLMELRLSPTKDLWPAVLLVLHQSGVAVEVCGQEATRRGGCRRFRLALHNIKSCGVAIGSSERRRWPAGGASGDGGQWVLAEQVDLDVVMLVEKIFFRAFQ